MDHVKSHILWKQEKEKEHQPMVDDILKVLSSQYQGIEDDEASFGEDSEIEIKNWK